VRYRRAADGQYRWFLSRAVPLRDGKGNIVRWYGVSTDIEDRKRAESLLAGEKRILEMVAKGDSLTEILDALCQFVEEQANGVLASVLLLDEGRLRNGGAPSLSKAYADAIDGTVVGPSAGSCGTAAYRGEQVIVEDIATDPLWANYRELALPHSLRACWSTPIFSSQGKVIATFAMYYREPRRPSKRDQEIIEQITHLAGVAIERKLTQDKLQRSEAYLTEAERVAHTGSWAYDPTAQKALYWSDEMFRIYGFDPHQGPPTSEAFLERVHPEDRESVDNTMRNAAQERTEYRVEHRIILPNGTIRHIHAVGHPVLDRSGNAVQFVGSAVDITDVKRAEEEREKLRQLEADLAHINRINMMGELAASLAHEIKQPIGAATTSASACLRWLAHDPPDLERARGAAMRVEQEGNRAADVINRLRSFYKKGAPPEREVIDVNAIVGEMIVLLRNEAVRHSVTIHPELAAYVPKILADRVQLQQVFMNLMLNAIEAMKHTGGELTITSRLDQQGQLTISVSDTGVGLPTEGTERIFDAFYTTKPQGTGMGLAISRSIVESHGGRLWATGNEKAGATFHFTLRNEAEAHA
jgi:PAS domain S-box-containing protein